jgi:uridine kinase
VTLLAIDGPAGAGKTTFAAILEAELSCKGTVRVIHMDDLYNGWENALSNALSEILDRISTAHLAGRECVIKIFNWHTMQFDREEKIELTDYLIIEGVGAAQQIVRETGATTYWLDIEPEIGLQRVLDRDGEITLLHCTSSYPCRLEDSNSQASYSSAAESNSQPAVL